MKTLIVFIATVTMLVGCGRGVGSKVNTPEEFRPYLLNFDKEAEARSLPYRALDLVDISFGSLGDDVHGHCENHVITIDEAFWKLASEDEREALVFHELGHCVLNRDHLNTRIFDFIGSFRDLSVMNSQLIEGGTFRSYKPQYLDELFSK